MSDKDTTRQPGQPPLATQPANFQPVLEAKMLLRGVRAGALATLDAASGAPFATLVTVATQIDGSPLLLLSALSAHTQNIVADARVSLLLAETGKGDPLTHPRLTLSGRTQRLEGDDGRNRFLARHPKAALYAGFPDFAFYRIALSGGHLNGGFAKAARLSAEELLTDLAGAQELVAAEAGAVAHMNEDHGEATRLYATRLLGRREGPWRLTGIDPEGCDLALGDETARLLFPSPVRDGQGLRLALKDLAEKARQGPSAVA
jgi:putative heme iron utilization protein